MKSFTLLLLTCSVFLFSQCDNNTPDSPVTGSSTTLEKFTEEPPDELIALAKETNDSVAKTTATINGKKKDRTALDKKLKLSIDEEIERQLMLNPDLPSLNTADDAFSKLTIELFMDLSKATGGETYLIQNASYVVQAITDIIKNYMSSETDLVFVIDKTGSMRDDIDEIKNSVNKIIKAIDEYDNTRVGFTFYGDKNADGNKWFSKYELTNDYESAKNVVKNIVTVGGGDDPESVNDGLAKTIQEMNWGEGRRRVILLLGDAPSIKPPFSDYVLEDIIAMAKAENVTMNFYPVVIGMKGSLEGILKAKEIVAEPKPIISSLAPNPATNYTLVKTGEIADYTSEVFDINGKLVYTKNFQGDNISIMTDQFPSGVYIVRILNNTNSTVDTKKFVVKH